MQRLDHLLAGGISDAIALTDRSRQRTYAELSADVAAIAGAIQKRIQPGDRVALWLPKSLECVTLIFAVSRAGGVVVPLNSVLRGQQVLHILEDSGAKLLISHRARASTLEAVPCDLLTLEANWAEMLQAQPASDEAKGADSLAALLYTSGSTGKPKGVMVTHNNLLVGARSVSSYLGTGADDRILSVLPLSFDFGLSQITTAFYRGAHAVLLDYLAPRDVVLACAKYRITQLAAVPPLWVQLVGLEWPEQAIANMRTLSNSGGRLPEATVRALRGLFPKSNLHLMYGLTEAFRSTTLPPNLADERPTSIGKAIPEAEILVVRPDGQLTLDDEPGELVHCGPLVTQGYWQDPVRTAQRFKPAPDASVYGGMAVWSGDTVVRDADGFLTFVGRADETIKTMGTRVSPTEIEEIAFQSGAASAAVALGMPDEVAGHKICLVMTPSAGLSEAEAETKLVSFFKKEAAPYMQPSKIVWLETFPVSANGKLDRAAIRDLYIK